MLLVNCQRLLVQAVRGDSHQSQLKWCPRVEPFIASAEGHHVTADRFNRSMAASPGLG